MELSCRSSNLRREIAKPEDTQELVSPERMGRSAVLLVFLRKAVGASWWAHQWERAVRRDTPLLLTASAE